MSDLIVDYQVLEQSQQLLATPQQWLGVGTGAALADVGVSVVSAAEIYGPTDFILHMTEFASK